MRGALSGVFQSAGARAERRGLDLGPVGSWVAGHHRALQIAGLLVAAAVLVFWGTPGIAGVIWIVVGLLVYLAIVEFVSRLTGPVADAGASPRPTRSSARRHAVRRPRAQARRTAPRSARSGALLVATQARRAAPMVSPRRAAASVSCSMPYSVKARRRPPS